MVFVFEYFADSKRMQKQTESSIRKAMPEHIRNVACFVSKKQVNQAAASLLTRTL